MSANARDIELARNLPNPHVRSMWILFWSMVACLAGAAVAIGIAALSESDWKRNALTSTLMIGGMIAGGLGLFLPLGLIPLRSSSRRIECFREAFINGQFLVRWDYSNETWLPYFAKVAAQAKKTRQNAMRLIVVILSFAVAGLVVGTFLDGRDGVEQWAVAAAKSVCITFIVMTLAIAWVTHRTHQQRTALLAKPQVTILGTLGAYANGRWLLWGTATEVLKSIAVTQDADEPAVLRFSIQTGQAVRIEDICIPPNQVALASKIARRITESPDAKGGGGMHDAADVLEGVGNALRLLD